MFAVNLNDAGPVVVGTVHRTFARPVVKEKRMKEENILTLRLRLTRGKMAVLLAAFFVCLRPGFLGSESLVLTTFYPAPFAGYAHLVVLKEATLARDPDPVYNKSYVRIGGGKERERSYSFVSKDTVIKLEVFGGTISVRDNNVKWGTGEGATAASEAALVPDGGGSIKLGGKGGVPYIQFVTAEKQYSAKLGLDQAGGKLKLEGDLSISGGITGPLLQSGVRVKFCEAAPFATLPSAATACQSKPGTNFIGFMLTNSFVPGYFNGTKVFAAATGGGQALCCKISY